MEATPLAEAGLRPFLSFERLTMLELPSSCEGKRCTFQLDDAIISELAVALPHLTYLCLGDMPCIAPPSGVTITSLVALSTNCVDLDFLQLHFDVKTIVSRDTYTNTETQRFTCKLHTLSVGFLPLPQNHDDALLVTFTIFHIFPYLEVIATVSQDWVQFGEAAQSFHRASKAVSS